MDRAYRLDKAICTCHTPDQPDASFAAESLLKNQEDIGNAMKPFYGEQAGNQLTSQLKDHITIAVDLLEADQGWKQHSFRRD